MVFGIFTLLVALTLAGVAGWFSIVGLMAIFSANAFSIAVMASALEVAKLVTASWLYQHWRVTTLSMKAYLGIAVITLMLITSMGIFGYLSKAHLEQSINAGGNNELQLQAIQRKIDRQQSIVADANTVLEQLDATVATLQEYDRIRGPEGAIAVRESQREERQVLNQTIDTAYTVIEQLQTQAAPLRKAQLDLEVEVGPLKYVADLIYGNTDASTLDQAVRLFILMLIFVFDPLAVMLILAANQSLARHGVHIERQHTEVNDEEVAVQELELTQATMAVSAERESELLERIQHLEAEKSELENRAPEIQEVVREVVKEVEVPGPERIVEVPGPERTIEVPGPERVVEVPIEVEREVVREVPVEKIVEKEVVREVEVPVEIERIVEKTVYVPVQGSEETVDDLDLAAKIWSESEFNHDGLTQEEIRQAFVENERQLKNKQGFWNIPLPKKPKA